MKESSFGYYLRNLPLTLSVAVLNYRGTVFKVSDDSTVAGVIPIAIKGKNLWQCMDILQVLHMDYLDSQKRKSEINYYLPEGTKFSWLEWQKGLRPVFKGLAFQKIKQAQVDTSAASFNRYCNTIFQYSSTQTFWHYYPDLKFADIQPGDFITKKGKKGHAVLILDIAINEMGEKVALIGQGDTPACQFYLLQKNGNPWFKIDKDMSYPDLPISKKMFWSGLRRF